MSNHAKHEPSQLRLDRANRKLLGVCGGLARYLDVPPALVRVIYCIACLASPILLLAYFILYWLLEDEERPDRIRSALTGFTRASNRATADQDVDAPPSGSAQDADLGARNATLGRLGFDRFNGTLYRSRKNVWIGGVCSGIANYLGIRPVIVRALTLISLFVLGGVAIWGYVILWIVLDKEPKRRRQTAASASYRPGETRDAGEAGEAAAKMDAPPMDIDACARSLSAAERRLRNVEAYMTSKQFRLHCEINRI